MQRKLDTEHKLEIDDVLRVWIHLYISNVASGDETRVGWGMITSTTVQYRSARGETKKILKTWGVGCSSVVTCKV